MNINFTLNEMKEYLEKLGYECRFEEEEEDYYCNGTQSETRKYAVWNLYYYGTPMTNIGFTRQFGTQRLETVFRDELKKRLLKLT